MHFNLTLTEYLIDQIGPKQLPFNIIIPFTIVYLLIFVTGVVGNFVVCVVIVRHSTMHSATNYYLFSLAISDLTLLLLGLPNDLSIFWHQYPYLFGTGICKLRALLSETASNVSVLTIVAFSMERYLAICHPLHLYTMSGLQRAIRIIAILWLLSLICAIPFAIFTEVNYLEYPPKSGNIALESAFCAMLYPPKWLSESSSIIFFVLPMLVILILYARMGYRIRNRTRGTQLQNGSVHGENRHSQNRKAIIRMLAAVVIAFFLCWAPFHAQRLLFIYFQDIPHFNTINAWMFYITGILYYVSSTVNPILYNVMSNRYRVAFKETLCGKRRHHRNGGYFREQSSFRETTMCNSTYEATQLVRVKSIGGSSTHAVDNHVNHHQHRCLNNVSTRRHNIRKDNGHTGGGNNVKWDDEKQLTIDNNTINNDNVDTKMIVDTTITLPPSSSPTNMVVILSSPNINNGKTKCFTTSDLNINDIDLLTPDADCCNTKDEDVKSNLHLVESCI
ncbi:neuropeptides capa receptor-like [Chrysoperla carnea]|uniref:neuropeptides capa receptor-like n=1 Tax=Chrysoperla carnea TaxID=189513 RepID=UPI001D07B71D|nr:neuropeptides capa receptor-like [Chrysoperla carnea]